MERKVIRVNLYRYDDQGSEDESRSLERGFSFLSHQEDLSDGGLASLLHRIHSKFQLSCPVSNIALIRESDGYLVQSWEELEPEMEIYQNSQTFQNFSDSSSSPEPVHTTRNSDSEIRRRSLSVFGPVPSAAAASQWVFRQCSEKGAWRSVSDRELSGGWGVRMRALGVLIPKEKFPLKFGTWMEGLSMEKWVVMICRGGKFAAGVFRGGKMEARCSFGRYVIRAKQGKRQANKDRSGKPAKSAGSALRRYHEFKLLEDIFQLMQKWKNDLASADRIFIHSPGRNKEAIFQGSLEEIGFHKGDARISKIPLTIKAVNLAEVQNTCDRLSEIQIEERVHH